MTRLTVPTILTVLTATIFASPAVADHGFYRTIDDQLFQIAGEARSLRWDVAIAPIRENDRRTWLRGMDDIYGEITDLQKSLFRGRSKSHLCAEIKDLREEICELRDDLTRLGDPTTFRYERGISGARFRCGVLPGGCVIPTNFVARLNALDQRAASLHALVAGNGFPGLSARDPFDLFHSQAYPHAVPNDGRTLTIPPSPQLPAPHLPGPSLNTVPPSPYAVPLPAPNTTSNFRRPGKRDNVINTVQWILSQID